MNRQPIAWMVTREPEDRFKRLALTIEEARNIAATVELEPFAKIIPLYACQQEVPPVAWRTTDHKTPFTSSSRTAGIIQRAGYKIFPLYTAPQMCELSDEEIKLLYHKAGGCGSLDWIVRFTRAVIAAARKA